MCGIICFIALFTPFLNHVDLVYNSTNIPTITAPASTHGFINNGPILASPPPSLLAIGAAFDATLPTIGNALVTPPAFLTFDSIPTNLLADLNIPPNISWLPPSTNLNAANANIIFIIPATNLGCLVTKSATDFTKGFIAFSASNILGANAFPKSANIL